MYWTLSTKLSVITSRCYRHFEGYPPSQKCPYVSLSNYEFDKQKCPELTASDRTLRLMQTMLAFVITIDSGLNTYNYTFIYLLSVLPISPILALWWAKTRQCPDKDHDHPQAAGKPCQLTLLATAGSGENLKAQYHCADKHFFFRYFSQLHPKSSSLID